jgi:hypothetical protein
MLNWPVNRITNPDLVCSHSYMLQYEGDMVFYYIYQLFIITGKVNFVTRFVTFSIVFSDSV